MLRAVAVLVVFALSLVPIGHLSAQPQPYEINAIVSLTGPAAFIGVSIAKTLGLVEAAANRHGGINGRPVKFVLADDQSSPQVTVQLLTREHELRATRPVPVVLTARGVGQRALIIDRWDKTKSEFVPVSRPAGYVK
jgi:hypothetical protein